MSSPITCVKTQNVRVCSDTERSDFNPDDYQIPSYLDAEALLKKSVYDAGQRSMEKLTECITQGDLQTLIEQRKIDCGKILDRAIESVLFEEFKTSIRNTLMTNAQDAQYLDLVRDTNGYEAGQASRFWITFNPRELSPDQIISLLHDLQDIKNFLRLQYVIETRSGDGTLSGAHAHFILHLKDKLYKSQLHQRLFSRWKKHIGNKKHIQVSVCETESYYKSKITYMTKDKSQEHPDDRILYPTLKEISEIPDAGKILL